MIYAAVDIVEVATQSGVALLAALIGAAATLLATRDAGRRALSASLEAQREELRLVAAGDRSAAIAALSTEMQLVAASLREGHVWYAHLVLPLQTLPSVMAHFGALDAPTRNTTTKAVHDLSKYNAVASYSNDRVSVGSGAADAEVVRLASSAAASLQRASGLLDQPLVGGVGR